VTRLRAGAVRAVIWICDAWWAGPLLVLLGMGADRGLRALYGVSAYAAEVYLGVAVLFVLCSIPAARSMRAGAFDIFELGVAFGGVYFLYFGVRALGILLNPAVLLPETPHPSVIIAGLPQAVWYAGLGMAAYLAGYRVPLRFGTARFFAGDTRLNARLVDGVAVTFYALGWLARLPELTHGWFLTTAAARYAGEVPPVVQSVSFFSILAVLGYALSLVALTTQGGERRGPRLLAAFFTPIEFLYAFLIGSKFHIGLIVCILLILNHYLRRRIAPTAVLGTILVFMFVVTPVVSEYRQVAGLQDLHLRSFAGEFPHMTAQVVHRLWISLPGQYFTIGSRAVLDRLSGVDGIAVTIRGVPLASPFIHGGSLAWAVKILVPTIVEPRKYDAVARVLSPVPYLFGYPDFSRGGIALTEVAEFYWNFGLAGILAGMFVVGLLQKVAVTWLLHPVSPMRIFIYSIVWPWMMVAVEGWAFFIYPNLFRLTGLAVLIAWGTLWLSRRHPVYLPAGSVGTPG